MGNYCVLIRGLVPYSFSQFLIPRLLAFSLEVRHILWCSDCYACIIFCLLWIWFWFSGYINFQTRYAYLNNFHIFLRWHNWVVPAFLLQLYSGLSQMYDFYAHDTFVTLFNFTINSKKHEPIKMMYCNLFEILSTTKCFCICSWNIV